MPAVNVGEQVTSDGAQTKAMDGLYAHGGLKTRVLERPTAAAGLSRIRPRAIVVDVRVVAVDRVQIYERMVICKARQVYLGVHQVELLNRSASGRAHRYLVMHQVMAVIFRTNGKPGTGNQPAHVHTEPGDARRHPLNNLFLLDYVQRMFDT